MKSTTVKKDELLGIVKENKAKHDTIYADAIKGFWETAEDEFTKYLALAKAREGTEGFHVGISYPTSYASEYDQAIKSLEMSVDDTIQLDHQEFSQLVMNQWHWRSSFLASNTMYVKSAAAISGCASF